MKQAASCEEQDRLAAIPTSKGVVAPAQVQDLQGRRVQGEAEGECLALPGLQTAARRKLLERLQVGRALYCETRSGCQAEICTYTGGSVDGDRAIGRSQHESRSMSFRIGRWRLAEDWRSVQRSSLDEAALTSASG